MKIIQRTGDISWGVFKRGGSLREYAPWRLERSGLTAWKRDKEMSYFTPAGTILVLPIVPGGEKVSLIPLEGSE